jgi:ATP-binding cassette subfamily B protein
LACFNASDYELDRFQTKNRTFVATLLRFQSTAMLGRTLPGSILTAATIAVFLYGGHQVILRQMTMGTLVAFMAYHARLLSPVQTLLGLSAALTSAKVSLSRVLELLDTPPEVVERPNAVPLCAVSKSIEFRNVTLRHEGRTVLDDISFELRAGCFSTIVGPSGSGKSTIAELMVRLLDPDEGAVLVDGVDIRDARLRDLRRTVVLIDQAPHVLHGSLRENIAYGNPGAPRTLVEAAAVAAGLGDLLQSLPNGLDTVAGERGLTLSAGERQRVAIARAFLLNPEVVILDEPSAALDPERELDLLESLRRSFSGKTLIAITHKPLLTSAADCVVHIEQGRLAREVAA